LGHAAKIAALAFKADALVVDGGSDPVVPVNPFMNAVGTGLGAGAAVDAGIRSVDLVLGHLMLEP
jgi:hypothetical protein